jgi:c-di-GMP-binding flagellar brake protein YcgR
VSRNPVRHDTRKHARATLELPVVVTDAANRARGAIRFASADVSGGGAFLRSEMLFEIGELMMVEFDLPGGRHVRVRGRVVRVSHGTTPTGNPDDEGQDRAPGMGVEFVDLSPEDRAAIEASPRN